MPRSSSTSRSSTKTNSHTTSPTVFRNPNSTVGHPVAPVTAPTFGQSMKDGFGLGIGSAIAQRVVGSILGAPTVNVVNQSEEKPREHPCDKEFNAFENCIKTRSMEGFCDQEQSSLRSCIQVCGPISQLK